MNLHGAVRSSSDGANPRILNVGRIDTREPGRHGRQQSLWYEGLGDP